MKKMIPLLPVEFQGTATLLSNALTNQIFKIQSFENPNQYFLLRIFGPLLSRKHENAIIQHLGQKGHPVKVEYIGDGYRIESWLEHKPVFPMELEVLNKEISKRLGWYHTLSPPITKNDVVLEGLYAMANETDYELPLKYLNCLSDKKLVLCHNDLQYGNILKTESGLVFVDFEYSGYSSRYFDIANHFCEYMANYSDAQPELMNYSKYPELDARLFFYKFYLKEVQQNSADSSSAQEEPSDINSFDQNVAKYSLLSHLYWGVWGLYKAQNETRSFDYKKYGLGRLQRFNHLWKNKIGEGNIPLDI